MPLLVLSVMAPVFSSCARQNKISLVRSGKVSPALDLSAKVPPDTSVGSRALPERDTLKVTGPDGREVYVMNAVLDEDSGEMVATERLAAAVVTARFSNVAERGGTVDLRFSITVPAAMIDSYWQLRFHPEMHVLGDSARLDDIIITGSRYRERELRGYEQYRRFLSRIVTDSTEFIDYRDLEIFMERNLPGVYAFRNDSSYVTDWEFRSGFGVGAMDAVEHYTRKMALRRNERLKSRKGKMYSRYVKSPPVIGGIRLDTVIASGCGDFVYDYVQTLRVRPGMRKADISFSGEVLEYGRKLHDVPETEPLTFYISSLSALVDPVEKYVKRVITRNASVTEHRRIAFALGSSEIDSDIEDNALEIAGVESTLRKLVTDPLYELDSVTVVSFASPEGDAGYNARLSRSRAESVSRYFNSFLSDLRDSLEAEKGIELAISGEMLSAVASKGPAWQDIVFVPRAGGENWDSLDAMVCSDTLLTQEQKSVYFDSSSESSADARESFLRRQDFYPVIRERYYPELREVRLDFALSRKGMIRDTVTTTQLDTVYMRGVQCIRDYDYDTALSLLAPYADLNTAVAYLALDRNRSAFGILSGMEKTPAVNYMLALVYSRFGEDGNAVEHYLQACRQDRAFVNRGNLDPEISTLIRKYSLEKILYEM